MIKGVYTYEIPLSVTQGIDGVRLYPITENRQSYAHFSNAEEIFVLIARQGAVNDMLNYFPHVRWLQLLNAGYEKVDLELLRKRDILFTNARSVYCKTIAEDVIAKMLFLARHYATHLRDQMAHVWPTDEQLPNENIDLFGRKLCILGAGNIGREIALRSRGFGMSVAGYDPYVARQEGFDEIVGDPAALKRLLGESDFVITSLPVTEETRDMVNRNLLESMKRDAYLINVSRGEIVDETALVWALNKGVIRGAAIDVARQEPLPADSPLWTARNLLITPHRAAYGDQMKRRMCALIERNLRHYLAGETLEDIVCF